MRRASNRRAGYCVQRGARVAPASAASAIAASTLASRVRRPPVLPGGLRLRSEYDDFAPTGIPDGFGNYLGAPITINGANGYSVTGQAIFQFAGATYPNQFATITNRDFVYAQTDYRVNSHIVALGAFRYEAERGSTQYTASPASSITFSLVSVDSPMIGLS